MLYVSVVSYHLPLYCSTSISTVAVSEHARCSCKWLCRDEVLKTTIVLYYMYKRLILLWAGSMHERVHTCSGSNRGAMHTVPLSRTNSMGRYTVSQQDLRPSLEMETASRHKPVIIYPKDMVQKHNGVRIRCTTTPSSAVGAFSTVERKLSNCQQFVCR